VVFGRSTTRADENPFGQQASSTQVDDRRGPLSPVPLRREFHSPAFPRLVAQIA